MPQYKELTLLVCAVEALVSSVIGMQEQKAWRPVWAALRNWSWCKDKRAPVLLKRWLKRLDAGRALPSATIAGIADCFSANMVRERHR